jgi:hypothetical protein
MDPIREYIHEEFWCTCFITSRGFPTWEPEGQRAGQGKTPRSFHPEDLALCQSSRVYPAEVDLQILRRYIRLGSNPSRLKHCWKQTQLKLGSGGQMQRTCPIFCRCESIGPRMKEWNPFVPNTGIFNYIYIFHILDANIFKNELPGPLSWKHSLCMRDQLISEIGWNWIWWKNPLELDGIGLQVAVFLIFLSSTPALFLSKISNYLEMH